MKNTIYISLLIVLFLHTACKKDFPVFELPQITTGKAVVTDESAEIYAYVTIPKQFPDRNDIYIGFEIEGGTYSNRYWERYWVCKGETINLSHQFTNLTPSSTYKYRCYIVDYYSDLSDRIYGGWKSFTTLPPSNPPSVTISDAKVSSVTSSTANFTVTITAQNTTIKECGTILGTSNSNLTKSNSQNTIQKASLVGSGITQELKNLSPATTYYVRAYAIDENNTLYYGGIVPFTTQSATQSTLMKSDFIGTYTLTAYSPWEFKWVTWNNVQCINYTGDTIHIFGFNDREDFGAVAIFDTEEQVVRIESNWRYNNRSFTFIGETVYASFTPVEYVSSENYAYWIQDGGKNGWGEIWLKKTSDSYYIMTASNRPDSNGRYANGFVFLYYSSSWEEKANTFVYTNVTMQRTSTTTTYAPSRQGYPMIIPEKSNITPVSHENFTPMVSPASDLPYSR